MSIRSKITAAFAMCISLPMAAGMGALWLGTQDTLHQQADQELQSATRNVMSAIEQQIATNLTHLKAWGAMPTMQDVLIGDEGGDLGHTISDLSLSYPEFSSLTITNAQGEVVATTDPALRKANLSALEGVHAAVSGRAYQGSFIAPRIGAVETITLTVPLVASYDRQTVIGTLVGALDLEAIARQAASHSQLGIERRILALAQRDTGRLIWSTRSAGSLTDQLKKIDIGSKRTSSELIIAGETHLATFVKSTGSLLERDPGLVAYGVVPTASVFAAADKVSNIFIAVAGLAALVALIIAWRWSTPLVQLAASMSRVARGDNYITTPQLPSHNTFAPLARALESMREVSAGRDQLVARELELIQAREDAEAETRIKARQLSHLSDALKDQISTIVELCELINRENVAAVSSRNHASYAHDISRSGIRLLSIVEEAIAQTADQPVEIPGLEEIHEPSGQRLSA